MNKSKRRLTVAAIIALAVLAIGYVLAVYDSGLNIYKKNKVKSYAKQYITDNYRDFKLSDVDVSYDRALNYYIADCKNDSGAVITLNYNLELFMEFDAYYNEKYTAVKVEYQNAMAKKLKEALKNSDLECDNIAVFVDLNASDKNKIVHNDAKIENERIECIITYVRKDGEAVRDKYEFAELARKVSKCIYQNVDEDAQISTLKIKYDYDETKVASISWSHRMDDMSLAEIADEIKY